MSAARQNRRGFDRLLAYGCHIRLRVHLASSREQSGEDKSCGNGDGEAISNLAQSNRAQTVLCGIRLAASRARTELSGSVLRSSERRSDPWKGSIKCRLSFGLQSLVAWRRRLATWGPRPAPSQLTFRRSSGGSGGDCWTGISPPGKRP